MSVNRRQFLKRAGLVTALGIGGSIALTGISEKLVEAASQPEYGTAEGSLKAKRWAMVVDMSKFKTKEDFQRIKEACVSIHNIPDFSPLGPTDEKKWEIKWQWEDGYENVFTDVENEYLSEDFKKMPFVVSCNHCQNPACVRACPTGATFQRADGIVQMDFHRCIGCRFCMGACPFGARSFNFIDPAPYVKEINPHFPTRTRGVVEKCLFCYERLEKGQMPACVDAAPTGGLIFGDLDDPNSEVRKIVSSRFTIRRKPELGTEPCVYYLIGGGENA